MRHRPPTRARCLTSARLVACASAAFLTSACAERHATLSDSPALPIAPIAVDASPRVMAERTSRLVSQATESSDTVYMRSALAAAEHDPARRGAMLATARGAAHHAQLAADAAIAQGDRLGASLTDPTTIQARSYVHWWALSRDRLGRARAGSLQAATAADSALRCGASACAPAMTRRMRAQSDAAALAAREAEAMVRIALSFVDQP